VQCNFTGDEEIPEMEHVAALHLDYIVQEAVLNAVKHGRAARVSISLARTGDQGILTVRDDGQGFQPPGNSHSGMGIRIMHYRARVIDATLNLQSQPGRGTEISCVFSPSAWRPNT
jgi:two-component system CheB/CheR fusion protein